MSTPTTSLNLAVESDNQSSSLAFRPSMLVDDKYNDQPTLLDVLLCCCFPSLRPSRLIYSILNTILNQFGIFRVDKMIHNLSTHPITKFIIIHYLKIISILIYLSISLILSGMGSLFFSLMLITYHRPPTQYDHPIFFIRNQTTLSANVTLLSHDTSKSLVQNGLYIDTFKIKFNLPESNVNRDIGMFSIHAEFYDRHNSKLYSTSRSVCVKSLNSNSQKDFNQSILKYKSTMSDFVKYIFSIPFVLFGNADEFESQSVEMLTETQLMEFNSRVLQRASHVYIWLSHDNLQIYSSSIQLFAKVTGIWHYFYQYPITCFLIIFPIAFLSNMSGFLLVGIVLFYKFIIKRNSENLIQQEINENSRRMVTTIATRRRKKFANHGNYQSLSPPNVNNFGTTSSSSQSDITSSSGGEEEGQEIVERNKSITTRIDSPSQSSTASSTTKRQATSNKLKKRLKKRIEMQEE